MEEKKGLGLFMLVLGIIFSIISLMTLWAVSLTWDATILIFTLPLIIFSISTIIFSIFLMFTEHMTRKLKGLILIFDGLFPVLASVYALTDSRLQSISDIRVLVTVPVLLAGAFFLIYGFFLILQDKYVSIKLRKKLNKILGLISITIGILNSLFFVSILTIDPSLIDQSSISLITWFLVGGVLIIFGFHLLIKKVESKKKK